MPRQIQQSFVKVQPDGSVLFDFDGHVHAVGLDLDAKPNTFSGSDNRVRWLDSGGAMVAEIVGWNDSATDRGVRVNTPLNTAILLRNDGRSNFVRARGIAPQALEQEWDAGAGLMRAYFDGVLVKSW